MKETDTQKPALIFDFGGVLLDWNPRYLYRKIFNGDEDAMERFLADFDFYAWNELQDAGRSFKEGIEWGCREYPQYCELIKIYDTRWAESIRGPIRGSIEILEALKKAGYSLYGLSNWSDEKFSQARGLFSFFDWFNEIIVSGAIKLAKPDPEIFQYTLEKIGRQAGECLLIDDNIDNIESAARLGFRVIHFQSPEQLKEELARFPWWNPDTW